jgi:hypothetical protein
MHIDAAINQTWISSKVGHLDHPARGGGYDDLAKSPFKPSKQGRGSAIEAKKNDKTKPPKKTINQSFRTPGTQVLTRITPLSAADKAAAASAFCIGNEQETPLKVFLKEFEIQNMLLCP